MSVFLVDLVLKARLPLEMQSRAAKKLVLVCLADVCQNDDGRDCYPSRARMARAAERTERTIDAFLDDLARRGFISQTDKPRQHRPRTWQLHVSRLLDLQHVATLNNPNSNPAGEQPRRPDQQFQHPDSQFSPPESQHVAPERIERIERDERNKEQAAASERPEGADAPRPSARQLAEETYARLKPETRRKLECEAASHIRDLLAIMTPERRARAVVAQAILYLETSSHRQHFAAIDEGGS